MESSLFALESDIGPLAVNILRDISEPKQHEQELSQQAFYDQLTNMPNRHYFYDLSRRALTKANRQKILIAFLYIDLDKFKPVNDKYGHNIGDLLLIEVSKRIISILREEDFVARLGGDEFACILSFIDKKTTAYVIVKRIVDKCSQPFIINKHEIKVSVSIGITFNDEAKSNHKELLQKADCLIYKAKQEGSGFIKT